MKISLTKLILFTVFIFSYVSIQAQIHCDSIEAIQFKNASDIPTGYTGLAKKCSSRGFVRELRTYENGKLNGEFSEYFLSGKLKEQGNYKDGSKDGDWIIYNTLSQEDRIEIYSDGTFTGFRESKMDLKREEEGLFYLLILAGVVIGIIVLVIVVGSKMKKNRIAEEKAEEDKKLKKEAEIREWIRSYKEEDLVSIFGDEVAKKIIDEQPWIGMSIKMVYAMYGVPATTESQELKTKKKETLVYIVRNRTTKRKVQNKYVFDDGVLVKIDSKTVQPKLWERSTLQVPEILTSDAQNHP